jgi:uncharacterized membrane protein
MAQFNVGLKFYYSQDNHIFILCSSQSMNSHQKAPIATVKRHSRKKSQTNTALDDADRTSYTIRSAGILCQLKFADPLSLARFASISKTTPVKNIANHSRSVMKATHLFAAIAVGSAAVARTASAKSTGFEVGTFLRRFSCYGATGACWQWAVGVAPFCTATHQELSVNVSVPPPAFSLLLHFQCYKPSRRTCPYPPLQL